ncbi:signal peptidase II [Agaribacterium sp. ZY112]|uniref:signal peptidase II n=1 Tax=Agaribacterium sp. ZY112 TaxID=3233574 RepID=UPI003526995E
MSSPKPASISTDKSKLLPWLWFAIAALVIVLDQWTKMAVSASFAYGERLEVIPSLFNLTLRHNYGVAFSIFDQVGGGQRWPLSALAAVVSIALAIWIWRIGGKAGFEVTGLSLVLGGALGNLYDRVAYGYVVDFIEFYWGTAYFPAFNIADSAICAGAACLLLDAFLSRSQHK